MADVTEAKLDELRVFSEELADAARTVITPYFRSALLIDDKPAASATGQPVTRADRESEQVIRDLIVERYPDHGIVGEEFDDLNPEAEFCWVLDPIDGTRNYASGIPLFSLVIGLVQDGEVLLGINYDPLRKEMFHAEKGKGAFLNDKRLQVTEKRSIEDSIIGFDLSYNDQGAANTMDVILSIWPEMQTARIMGSAALGISYVAAGRTDLYFHHKLQPWDQVAGIILVQEAGGVITDRNGRDISVSSDGLIASNEKIHSSFLYKTTGLKWRDPN